MTHTMVTYLLCRRQTMRHTQHLGKSHSSVYYRRGEDMDMEYSPLYNVTLHMGQIQWTSTSRHGWA
eukprot:1649624-Amphidinium_carterae.6